MRIPLLSGIIADGSGEFKESYPTNLEVVPVDNKIAAAQFRATSGAITLGTGPGVDRGGINWNGTLYRVLGTKLCSVSSAGIVTILGDVGGSGPVTLDYSFDRLIVRSSAKLFYWSPSLGLIQVTDPNLGPVVDMMWIDGYTMSTDGESIVVTELEDPTKIVPLNYGSAEEDPDPVTGLIKVRDEPYIVGRHTIQVFSNDGGNGFPFSDIKGAQIPVGCVGPMAKCLFVDTFAFCGSGRNEALGIYVAGNGAATRISTRAVDDELAGVENPSHIILESRTYREERRLFVHLPTKTLVYQYDASRLLEQSVWYVAQSGVGNPYRIRNAVNCYNAWCVGDFQSSNIGLLSEDVSTHFGEAAQWLFDVGLVYNGAKGGVISSLELVGLPGRAPLGVDGSAWLSMTRDGQSFTTERAIHVGLAGQTNKRLQWRPRTNFRLWMGFRFRGYSSQTPGFACLEAHITPLAA